MSHAARVGDAGELHRLHELGAPPVDPLGGEKKEREGERRTEKFSPHTRPLIAKRDPRIRPSPLETGRLRTRARAGAGIPCSRFRAFASASLIWTARSLCSFRST